MEAHPHKTLCGLLPGNHLGETGGSIWADHGRERGHRTESIYFDCTFISFIGFLEICHKTSDLKFKKPWSLPFCFLFFSHWEHFSKYFISWSESSGIQNTL
jgi:hypothetical protein